MEVHQVDGEITQLHPVLPKVGIIILNFLVANCCNSPSFI
jgi:hypothetical protein